MSLCYTVRKDRSYHDAQPVSFEGAYRQTHGVERLTYDILYYIASLLDLQTLQAWRATSTRADAAAGAFLTSRYHRLLRRHFDDPTGFRAVLRMTGAVISGSVALNILDRERADRWEPKDLDIFVPVHFQKRLHSYLTKVEKYAHIGTHTPSHYDECTGFLSISQYENEDGMCVDLIKSFTHSAIYPIPWFWSTHVMNYISADSFSVAYPTLTLQGRAILSPGTLLEYQYPDPRVMSAMAKYRPRGYDFRRFGYAWEEDVNAECAQEHDENCPRTIRYFGDRFCLTGSFNDISRATWTNETRAQPDKALLVRWWRGGQACGGNCVHTSNSSTRYFPHVATYRVPPAFYDTPVEGQSLPVCAMPPGF